MATRFSHLHTHSHYSLLNALPKIPDLVKAAKKYGMPALALTDNGNMYATIEFYKECKKEGIKPIIGVDAYMALRTRKDKESIDKRRSRIILLAKNDLGYKNLIKIVTFSHLEGFYYKPRVDRELLEKYHEGIICIAPALGSDITNALKISDQEKALERLDFYKKTFGEDFYLEITHHPELENHETLMNDLKKMSKEKSVPLVAAQEVYYMTADDRKARQTLLSVQSNNDASDRGDDDEDFSFMTPEQAEKNFKDTPEALENIQKIIDKCNVEIVLGSWVFPAIEAAEGKTYDDTLRDVVYAGFEKRNVEKSEAILKRVEYELEVIKNKGYSPYFLVVADLLHYARTHGILSNIRGSVSGSMITYLAGITNIDPLEYQIPFERFLNPERPSAPDIDMDFADNRRDEMVDYARRKYGHDKVAQIGTFGTMAARGSVRDAARALGFSIQLSDTIAKAVPMGSQGFPMTLERALEEAPDLKKMYDEGEEVKTIVDMAMKIEGSARHVGIHAAGVVISPTDLMDYTPLQFDPKGDNKIISQYDMYSVEEAGLLKFDFLGLKNLSIIADAIRLIALTEKIQLDVDTIPVTDKKTFEMLARGETADTFQLNGSGMTKFLVELKPTTIHDINAMVALYRPGPIQFIPEYIARKHDHTKIKYLDPALEPILEKTYGILVYQDDLLMMANKLAGYSWGEVDKFRKAVGKKIPEEMAKQKEKFINGCIKYSGWPEKKAQEIWLWIEPFAAYGFNKAHSVSYGRVAYITAYLKANHPGEYMAAVLTADSGDVDKISESIAECKRMGIEVLPPDVNESYQEFTIRKKDGVDKDGKSVVKNVIRFGLNTIKNFGEGISGFIIAERKINGPYKSMENFLDRIKDRSLNRKSLEALIKAGAMDTFGERGSMLGNIDDLLAYNKEKGGAAQDSLFAGLGGSAHGLKLRPMPDATMAEKLAWEKELLGLYISGHPLDLYTEKVKSIGQIARVKEHLKEGIETIICGVIETIRVIKTKKDADMAFIKLTDKSGSMETVVFPKSYEKYKEILVADTCIAIKGKVSERNGEKSLLADIIKKIS
ncbi:TPA: DNA polymerase III subunit alpha [Candidatus Taylorbacteria bacterium]|nr:DNA polymerase III subunit alpha [Candidatus Taylorbacteria bacterium]